MQAHIHAYLAQVCYYTKPDGLNLSFYVVGESFRCGVIRIFCNNTHMHVCALACLQSLPFALAAVGKPTGVY